MTDDLKVAIKVTLDGRQAIGETNAVAGAIDKVGDNADAAAPSIGRMVDAATPFGKAALGFNEVAEAFSRLGGYVGDAAALADKFAGLTGRLQIAVGEGQAFATAFESVRSIANATGSEIDATATLFGRLTTATRELGLSQGQVARLTETIGKSFAVSGASAAEAEGAIRQLAQGLGSGALRGDEFNSVMEQAPRLAQALAAGLNVTTGELRKMAEEGKLTAEAVTTALSGQADAIAADFEKMPRTIGRAMQAAQNEFLVFVGELDKAKGVSAGVAGAIDGLAKHIDSLGQVALSVGAVAFAGMAAKIAAAFVESGMAVKKSIVDMQAKKDADLDAAKAAEVHAAAEKSSAHATLQAASARQAAAQAALLESQATLKAAADVSIYGAQRAAAERGVTVAREQLAAATVALTAAERANMVATGQLTAAKTAATAQAGLLGTAMKALPLPVNIMLAVAGFEALTAGGKALGEGIAKLTPEMRALDAAAAKFSAEQARQAGYADDAAHSLSAYKDVAAATAGEVARMSDVERAAYERRLIHAQEYQEAALNAAIAAEAIGKKSAYSAAEAGKALQDLRAGLAAFRDQTQVFDSIGASIDAAKTKLLAGFNVALQEAEKKGKGAQDALEKMVKAADLATPVGINALAAALQQVESEGKASAQAIDKDLRGVIAKLSTEDLAKLGITAQAAFDAAGAGAKDTARIVDAVLAESFKKLGVDTQKLAGGIGKEFSDLAIIFNQVAESARATGPQLVAAFTGLVKKAQTAEEFRQLDQVFDELKTSGKLSADEIARAYGEMAAKVAAAGSQMDSALGDALDRMGAKNGAQMQAIAASLANDFGLIAKGAREGAVSVDQMSGAFAKYAAAAIAANNGVVSSTLKAQAAALGMTDALGKLATANVTAEKAARENIDAIDAQAKITELAYAADLRAADAKIRAAKAALEKAEASGDEAAATQAMNDLTTAEIEKTDQVVQSKQAVADAARAKADAVRAEAEADGMVTDAERVLIAQSEDYANSTWHEAQAAREAAGAIRDKAAALRDEASARRWLTDENGFALNSAGKTINEQGGKGGWGDWDLSELKDAVAGLPVYENGSPLAGIDRNAAQKEIDRRAAERRREHDDRRTALDEELQTRQQADAERLVQSRQQRETERQARPALSAGFGGAPVSESADFGTAAHELTTAARALVAAAQTPQAARQPAQNIRIDMRAADGWRAEVFATERSQAEDFVRALRDAGMVARR